MSSLVFLWATSPQRRKFPFHLPPPPDFSDVDNELTEFVSLGKPQGFSNKHTLWSTSSPAFKLRVSWNLIVLMTTLPLHISHYTERRWPLLVIRVCNHLHEPLPVRKPAYLPPKQKKTDLFSLSIRFTTSPSSQRQQTTHNGVHVPLCDAIFLKQIAFPTNENNEKQ